MTQNTSFVLAHLAMGFGEYDDADELLHPELNRAVSHYAATETQYFGFSVPEERIHGLGYFWHHPKLGVISGGVTAFQGIKHKHLAAEIYDQRMFMSDQPVAESLAHYRTDVGYEVHVREPFKTVHLSYADQTLNNALDITYTALAPPAMLPNRKHFEQPMRTSGSITLRGKTYAVNGYNVRDRSWGEARTEESMKVPPVVWLTGVFNDEFSFNALLMDDPSRAPDWAGLYDIAPEQALRGGWIRRNGEYLRIVKASQVTRRDPVFLHPVAHELELIDERGNRYELHGTIVASCPAGYWPNANIYVGLVNWQCDGHVGWGDSQECQWSDFVHKMLGS